MCKVTVYYFLEPLYDELYASGIRAYLDGDWMKCVQDIEEAIKLYQLVP